MGCKNMFIAALVGHLNVLQWAREHNYDWNAQVCVNAATSGQLIFLLLGAEILIY